MQGKHWEENVPAQEWKVKPHPRWAHLQSGIIAHSVVSGFEGLRTDKREKKLMYADTDHEHGIMFRHVFPELY